MVEYTKKELAKAKEFIDDKEMYNVLWKCFVQPELDITSGDIGMKDDKELGEVVRADIRANFKIQVRMRELEMAVQKMEGEKKDKKKSNVPE